jgi:hypothetical protein
MNRRATLTMATTSLMFLAVGLSASASLAQQRSLKEKLIGTWTLVSSDQVRPDGSKVQQFGADPQGINVFDPNGNFFIMVANPDSLMVASTDNLKLISNNRSITNSEEFGGLIAESIAYYGTYVVNESEKVVTLHLDASTFPNQVGTDQQRTVTSIRADELMLKYSNPAAMSGVQVHQVWERTE